MYTCTCIQWCIYYKTEKLTEPWVQILIKTNLSNNIPVYILPSFSYLTVKFNYYPLNFLSKGLKLQTRTSTSIQYQEYLLRKCETKIQRTFQQFRHRLTDYQCPLKSTSKDVF